MHKLNIKQQTPTRGNGSSSSSYFINNRQPKGSRLELELEQRKSRTRSNVLRTTSSGSQVLSGQWWKGVGGDDGGIHLVRRHVISADIRALGEQVGEKKWADLEPNMSASAPLLVLRRRGNRLEIG